MTSRSRAKRIVRPLRLALLVLSIPLLAEGYFYHGIYAAKSASAIQARHAVLNIKATLAATNRRVPVLSDRETTLSADRGAAEKQLKNAIGKACASGQIHGTARFSDGTRTLTVTCSTLWWLNLFSWNGSRANSIAQCWAVVSGYDELIQAMGSEVRTARARATSLARELLDEESQESAGISNASGAKLAFFLDAGVGIMFLAGANARRRPVRRTPNAKRPQLPGRGGFLSSDGPKWTHILTVSLVNSAVSALDDPADMERYSEEWASDMAEIAGNWHRLQWALMLRLFAPHGIRAAHRRPVAERY
jgi:hypothetical protein